MISKIKELEKQLSIRVPDLQAIDNSIAPTNDESRLSAVSLALQSLLSEIKSLFPTIHESAVQINKDQAILFTGSEIKVVPVNPLYELSDLYLLSLLDILIHTGYELNIQPLTYSARFYFSRCAPPSLTNHRHNSFHMYP